MDAVVNIFDIGKRQKMLKPVGGVISGKFNLPGFDALNDAYVQAIIANNFHFSSDLVGRDHVRLLLLKTPERFLRASSLDPPAKCDKAKLW